MNDAAELARQLKNIGPAMARKMIDAGIDTPEKLRSLGARQAFLAMYGQGDYYGDFNAAYLYALEGAILDCDWSEIPADTRKSHQVFAQELQNNKRSGQ